MNIIETRAIRGPNYYSSHPVIFIHLDIEAFELKPTDLVPNCQENLEKMMPSLYEHKCSIGTEGGFFKRVRRGTWAGHVVEHVAIELQRLAGHDLAFGKTFSQDQTGHYHLVYHYINEVVGLRAGEMAVQIVEKLFNEEMTNIKPLINELKDLDESTRLGPSTQSIVSEAANRGISHIRLNEDSYVQLGFGKYQRRFQATIVDSTSALGVEIADDKERTKNILASIGVPVPQGKAVASLKEARQIASDIGYPVVVKPLVGNHGRGITVNVKNEEQLTVAFEMSTGIYDTCLVEKFIKGFDYRVLVIDGKFVAAALREPAFVIGNGHDSIEELIHKINQDPDRGDGHEKILTKILIDDGTKRALDLQELRLNDVLAKGKKVYVKETANLSTGGTALDVTESVHPFNRLMAERIARSINLNIMGIDIVAQSLARPLEIGSSGVLEVNAAPGFRMHLNPSDGKPRNIATHVIDMLFPPEEDHSMPICAVTGTNGKTTTTTMISHILTVTGKVVGMTSTDAVIINGVPVLKGDYSGPEGAKTIMMDSTVDHAVLEVARGGILRRGLGFDECDVGILLNISSDHLGDGGIDTMEELTRLKSTVTEAVKPDGYAIFNADDPLVMSCVGKTKGQVILFSKDSQNTELKKNLDAGNINVTLKDGEIIIQKADHNIVLGKADEIPITFGGKATFNIENVMAAVAASYALGVSEEEIRQGLMSFCSSIDQLPGRMNFINMGKFQVIVDYNHNVGAVKTTGEFIQNFMPGRKIRVASGVGSRWTQDIYDFGAALAKYYDHFILCDCDPRKRPIGETTDIIQKGLFDHGIKSHQITIAKDEKEAVINAIQFAKPGDLVMIQANNVAEVIKDVLKIKKLLIDGDPKLQSEIVPPSFTDK